jgi:hypothetical protein
MNKKGAIFHWIFFIVLIALAVFFMYNNKNVLDVGVKGEWSTDFLTNNYLPAKKILLENNILAKETATATFLELAKNGGFSKGTDSECGKYSGTNLWNEKNKFCFPNVGDTFSLAMAKNLQLKSNKAFWNVGFNDNFISGKGDMNSIVDGDNEYSFNDGFATQLFYRIDDYDALFETAVKLLNKCNNASSSDLLKGCLETEKLTSWSYGDCQTSNYNEQDRKVGFCAIGPYRTYLSNKESGEKELVKYNFALDFTPTEAISVDSSEIQADDNEIIVIFNHDETAESYTIYYTDYLNLEGQTGNAQEMFGLVPDFLGYNTQTFWIANWQDSCSFTSPNQAYICNSVITYKFNKVDLVTKSGGYLFAITSLREGTESEIREMVMIS